MRSLDFGSFRFGVGVWFVLAAAAAAQPPTAPLDPNTLLQRIEAQDRRIVELEAQMSRIRRLPDATAGAANDRQPGPIEAVSNQEKEAPAAQGTLVRKGDVSGEKPTMEIKGRVHADYFVFANQDAASEAAFGDLQNYFEFRRVRIGVGGKGYGVYEYELEVDFEPENNFTVRNAADTGSITIGAEAVSLKDAWVSLTALPILGTAKFGHFKQPFSLEEMTSANYITFMERGLPNAFSPGRDVGAAAFDYAEDETMTWGYGVFFNDVDDIVKERIGDQQGVNLAGRVTWLPYYSWDGRYLVHVGAGYIFSDVSDDSVTFSTRPETHEEDSFLSTGALAAENFQLTGAELAVVWGPWSVQSEVFGVSTDGVGAAPNDQYWGAYAYVSCFLTGEHRPYERKEGKFARIKPLTQFWVINTADGHCAGWGAWEAALRWSYIDLDDRGTIASSRGQLNDITLGLNWYWNPNTRWMLNYIHAFGDRADVGQNDTDILGVSLRFDF
jgi:phosphate-selective porin OprO/OprP